MDDWRKNVAPKYSRRPSTALSTTAKRIGIKENRASVKPNRQLYVNSPKSRGSRWLANKALPSRKSITRRLSFPKNDDSICLMNLEEAEKTNKIPGRLQDISLLTVSLASDDDSKRAAGMTSHASCDFIKPYSEPKLGISKETMDYLREIGIVKSPGSRAKKFSSPKTVVESYNSDPQNLTSTTQINNLHHPSKVQCSIAIDNLEEVFSRHSKEREELRLCSMRRREELDLQLKKEMEDLEKRHEKEMNDIFLQMKENKTPEPALVPVSAAVPAPVPALAPATFPTPVSGTTPNPVPALAPATFPTPVPGTTPNTVPALAPATFPTPVPGITNPVPAPGLKFSSDSFEAHDLSLVQDSLLQTPSSGAWLVSENIVLTTNNTPNQSLNTMLDDMTLNGKQSFMETPATRRLVTRRILQGIESLFL